MNPAYLFSPSPSSSFRSVESGCPRTVSTSFGFIFFFTCSRLRFAISRLQPPSISTAHNPTMRYAVRICLAITFAHHKIKTAHDRYYVGHHVTGENLRQDAKLHKGRRSAFHPIRNP